jgi:hypothetical protein
MFRAPDLVRASSGNRGSFARRRLAPAIWRVANEPMEHRCEMRPASKPNAEGHIRECLPRVGQKHPRMFHALRHHEPARGFPAYARNRAAKCIGLRPAARARFRRRIGWSICDPMYCLTRANRHFGSGEIGRSWSGDFIVSLADAQVRMAEYRNRGQSLAGSLAISFAAPRACNNCSIRGSHGKNRSRRRGEPNSASLIARESAAAKPSWGPGIRQARAYSRRHADLGCPARLMRLALATALSIPDLDNSRVTP